MLRRITTVMIAATILFGSVVLSEAKQRTFFGEVQPISTSIYMQGSHYLLNDQEVVAILTGNTLRLNQLEGNFVSVTGFVTETIEGELPLVRVIQIQRIPTTILQGTLAVFGENDEIAWYGLMDPNDHIIAVLTTNDIDFALYNGLIVTVTGNSYPVEDSRSLPTFHVDKISAEVTGRVESLGINAHAQSFVLITELGEHFILSTNRYDLNEFNNMSITVFGSLSTITESNTTQLNIRYIAQ